MQVKSNSLHTVGIFLFHTSTIILRIIEYIYKFERESLPAEQIRLSFVGARYL